MLCFAEICESPAHLVKRGGFFNWGILKPFQRLAMCEVQAFCEVAGKAAEVIRQFFDAPWCYLLNISVYTPWR